MYPYLYKRIYLEVNGVLLRFLCIERYILYGYFHIVIWTQDFVCLQREIKQNLKKKLFKSNKLEKVDRE